MNYCRWVFIIEANKNYYQTIIIGGGPTGLAAGMYAGRLGLKTLVLTKTLGGTIILTDVVENYPGFKRLTGLELTEHLKEHALDYNLVAIKEEEVMDVRKSKDLFEVKTEDNTYIGKTLIFATGTKHRELNAPGVKEFANRGVHYCALCDGPIYKDKAVCVIGGSDSAGKEALVLSRFAKKVYMIYRGDDIHPEPINKERIAATKNIEIIHKTNVVEVKGDKFVTSIVLDKPYNGNKEIRMDAVFIAIGLIPLSDFAKKLGVKINDKGEIIINRKAETNVEGVFAAGDVVDTEFKQAITGVGEGVTAAYGVYKYCESKEIMPT